jgi:IS4 transposase
MDRAYLDYGKYDDYCVRGIRLALALTEESTILRDVKVILGKGNKRMQHALRMIETVNSKGNPVRILTNRFDLTAEGIGDLYRSRWQIEIFFRWVKQNLKLTCFYGTEENAIMNQIWVCLIAYCLLLLMKLEMALDKSLTELMDLLITLLWKPWNKLQVELKRKPSRTSRGRQKKQIPVSVDNQF